MDVEDPAHDGAEHPMRKVTRQVAFEHSWDKERSRKVADLFNGMASDWTADHDVPGRYAALDDALDRGLVDGTTTEKSELTVVELGSGTGLGTRALCQRFSRVAAMDLALGMLQEAPADLGLRVQTDAAALPLPTGSVDVLVLVNMLLFPDEAARVLAPTGQLVWVNTVGEQTPIHLSATDVARALPGDWHGVASRAGRGTWTVVSRS